MKVDEKSKKELVKNLKQWSVRIADEIKNYIKDIEASFTEEELMEAKNKLLHEYLFEVPFGPELCYFCILQGLNDLMKNYDKSINEEMEKACQTCPYGKIHGHCQNGGDDYSKISDLYDQLISLLEQGTYYNYERYDR